MHLTHVCGCALVFVCFLSRPNAGFLLQKELDYLGGAVDDPKRPFAAIVGGSKVLSRSYLPFPIKTLFSLFSHSLSFSLSRSALSFLLSVSGVLQDWCHRVAHG